MYRFIESIRLENHRLQHLDWHNRRFNDTRRHFHPDSDECDLGQLIDLPDNLDDGVYKCRVVYSTEIEDIQFLPYLPKTVRTLKLVVDNHADYTYKYEQRAQLDFLLTQKGEADDILIVRDECLTDLSFANVALFDGFHWYTPDTFLLNGTCRQRLLAEGILRETRITIHDLHRYEEIRPINAMLLLERTPGVRLLF